MLEDMARHLRMCRFRWINGRNCLKCFVRLLLLFAIFSIINTFIALIILRSRSLPGPPAEIGVPSSERYITKFKENYWKNTTVKKILIWTPFFKNWGWLDDAKKALPLCSTSCAVTANRDDLETSDAVLFHASDLWTHQGLLSTIINYDIEMPRIRTPNQVWVLWTMEPMAHMWGKVKPNVFNWTVLYRRDSTIIMPFSSLIKKTEAQLEGISASAKLTNFAENKNKFAVTLVSNCYDQAKRYRLINDLQKHIEVDYFGACSGKMICSPGVPTFDCGEKYFKSYKFYLAFENSFCRDYISEKFWNALHRRQIPVIAAPNITLELLPPHSYLNVFDFPSIKDLAEQMIQISENNTLFNSYFQWTKYYTLDPVSTYCKLCMELHANKTAQSYHDMDGWMKDDSCQKSSVTSLVSGAFDRLLFDLGLN